MKPKLRVLDLFSGIGGLSLGLERTGGFETVAFCEIEPFPRRVLAKHWPKVPCYHDVRTLTASQLVSDGIGVDVICGGFPCQDVSVAGRKDGIEGARSGLYREYIRLVGDIRPRFIIMENVTGLLNGGLHAVLGALAQIGYDAEWHCVRAARFGLPHKRDRIWIVAHPSGSGWQRLVTHNRLSECQKAPLAKPRDTVAGYWMQLVADKCGLRTGDGVSLQLERHRLKSLGNAVVPDKPEMIGNAILNAIGWRESEAA